MAEEQKVRISRLQEGHKGTSAKAPAVAVTAKAISAVPVVKKGTGT
jgi:hypothetical protein